MTQESFLEQKVFLNENLKPYNALTRAEKHILLDAVIDSNCECFFEDAAIHHCGWGKHNGNMEFMPYGVYRTKPKEYKKLNVPWNVIDEKWKYTAMDDDNELYLFTEHPTWRNGFWSDLTDNGDAVCVDKVFKLDTTGIVAEHSLTQRPEGV